MQARVSYTASKLERGSAMKPPSGFEPVRVRIAPLPPEDEPIVGPLLKYWRERRNGRPMPARADIDPTELLQSLGRIHLLEVVGPGLFRFRLYGSQVTNPDRADMTGRMTRDYKDKVFGRMVTQHLAQCADSALPVLHHIEARLGGEPYEYRRLTLPLGDDAVRMLLVGTRRIQVTPDPSRERLGGNIINLPNATQHGQ